MDLIKNEKFRYGEPAVTLFLRHMFTFFYGIGISPARVKFDPITGSYCKVGGSLLNKTICILLLGATVIQATGVKWFSRSKPVHSEPDMVLNTLLAFSYCVFIAGMYWSTFARFDAILEILKEIRQILQNGFQASSSVEMESWAHRNASGLLISPIETASKLYLNFHEQMRKAAFALIGLCTLMSIAGTYGFLLPKGNLHSASSIGEFFEDIVNSEARLWLALFGSEGGNVTALNAYRFSDHVAPAVTALLVPITLMWLCWVQYGWASGFCMMISLGLAARMLLKSCGRYVQEKDGPNVQEKLGAFKEVVGVIDKLNGVYGWVILFSVFTGTLYFSVNVFTLFQENGPLVEKVIVFLCLSWFALELWAVAQVYEEAMKVGQTLMTCFEAERSSGLLKGRRDGDGMDTLIILLQQNLHAKTVGFKGLGFFTCSYAFIGTVLGMISTYSMIVIQFRA